VLPAAFKLRLVGLVFTQGRIVAQNADNGVATAGAVWGFSTESGASLRPGAMTMPRQLQFKLFHGFYRRGPLSQANCCLIEIYTKILGR
jgi:hypothetical protein